MSLYIPQGAPFSPDDPEDVKLAKLLLDGYAKTIREVQKNQEYLEWKNSLSFLERAKHEAFLNCYTPSPEIIIAKYEDICNKALEIVKDTKNRNAILKKKRWFDEKKAKFFSIQKKEEEKEEEQS